MVIYNNKIPKISYATDVSAFLIESVCSLIEIKSNLNNYALVQAHKSAKNAKKIAKTRSNKKLLNNEELYEPRIFNYLFAYNSSLSLKTIEKRWGKLDKAEGLNQSPLPIDDELKRINYPSESLDGVFILKKGCIIFDNLEVELKGLNEKRREIPARMQPEMYRKLTLEQQQDNILILFLLLMELSLQKAW